MSRGDSIRQTASMARCVSVVVTPTDHIIFNQSAQACGAVWKTVNDGGPTLLRDRFHKHVPLAISIAVAGLYWSLTSLTAG